MVFLENCKSSSILLEFEEDGTLYKNIYAKFKNWINKLKKNADILCRQKTVLTSTVYSSRSSSSRKFKQLK